MHKAKTLLARLAAAAIALSVAVPFGVAFADDALGDVDTPNVPSAASSAVASDSSVDTTGVTISKNGDAAEAENSSFAIGDFSRAQKGTNRDVDGEYHGYSYLVGRDAGTCAQLVAGDDYVVAYVPEKIARDLDIDLTSSADQASLKAMFVALDAGQAAGSKALSSFDTWYFTSDKVFEEGAVRFEFDQEVSGKTYVFVIGVDGGDLTKIISSLRSPISVAPLRRATSLLKSGRQASPLLASSCPTWTGALCGCRFARRASRSCSFSFWACSQPISASISRRVRKTSAT